jgi:hypothetical protein
MSRGYIVIAQNTDTVDYLKQAYALALNLKLTQKKVNGLTKGRIGKYTTSGNTTT